MSCAHPQTYTFIQIALYVPNLSIQKPHPQPYVFIVNMTSSFPVFFDCDSLSQINDECRNGGVCSLVNNVPVCTCPSTFTGSRCETPLSTFHSFTLYQSLTSRAPSHMTRSFQMKSVEPEDYRFRMERAFKQKWMTRRLPHTNNCETKSFLKCALKLNWKPIILIGYQKSN